MKLLNKNYKIVHQITFLLQLFKPQCPKCGSRDNKIECYAGNPYAKNERYETSRQCNNCVNFWYS
jgi:hypothetical protein